MSEAATFYGLTPILVPQDQSLDMLAGILTETKADVLVAGAGAVPLNELLRHYPSLKQVIWVVERTSRHMDWNEVPEGAGGKADIAAWHDIIDEKGSTSAELPTEVPGGTLPNIIMVAEDSMSAFDSYEVVEFTQKVCQICLSSIARVAADNLYRISWPPLVPRSPSYHAPIVSHLQTFSHPLLPSRKCILLQ